MNELVWSSVADAAAALDHATQQIIAGEVGQVLAIAAMCDLYQVDEDVLFEGAEEWITGGAAGTPRIGEFLAGEIAALLGISVGVAGFRIADVLNLRHRHPRLWDRVVTGKVRFWQATEVTQRCADAGLSLAASLWVDQKMATALMLLPWGRVKNLAIEWIIQADPELARERAERLAASRYVTVEQIRDGHCDMYGRLDAVDGILFDQALDVVAGSIDPTIGDKDVRRAAAVGALARNVFGQAQLPQPVTPDQVEVSTDNAEEHTPEDDNELGTGSVGPVGHVGTFRREAETVVSSDSIDATNPSALSLPSHLDHVGSLGNPTHSTNPTHSSTPGNPGTPGHLAGAVSVPRSCELIVRVSAKDLTDPKTGIVDIHGRGLLFADQLGDLLTGCKVTVRPIIDPETAPPTDSYRIPDDMRLAVEERNPFDVFPYGTKPSRSCDLDHTIPFDHQNAAGAGQTRLSNLGPLSRYTHRLKTHGGWRLTQPEPGVFRWESPLGYRYLVTPQGTIRIRRPEPPPPRHWWQVEPPDPPEIQYPELE